MIAGILELSVESKLGQTGFRAAGFSVEESEDVNKRNYLRIEISEHGKKNHYVELFFLEIGNMCTNHFMIAT